MNRIPLKILVLVLVVQILFRHYSLSQDTILKGTIVPVQGLKAIFPCVNYIEAGPAYFDSVFAGFSDGERVRNKPSLRDSIVEVVRLLQTLKGSLERETCILPLLSMVDSLSIEKARRFCVISPRGGSYFFGYCDMVDIKFALLFYLEARLGKRMILFEKDYFVDIKIVNVETNETVGSSIEYDRIIDLYAEAIAQYSASDFDNRSISLLNGTKYRWKVTVRREP